jgi:hypothetical protein
MSRPRPSAALVVASLALLVAVAQPGYAAIQELGKNSVGSRQLKAGAVKTDEVGRSAVTSPKIKNRAVKRADLGVGAVGSTQVADGSVVGVDLAPGSVDFSRIADGTVGRSELAASVRPPLAGTFTAAVDAPVTIGAQLTQLGALSTSGTGRMPVVAGSWLHVTGKLHVNNPTAATLGLGCRVYVNGVSLEPPVANEWVQAGYNQDVPIVAAGQVPSGPTDVSLACVGSMLQVQWVRVNVVAYVS